MHKISTVALVLILGSLTALGPLSIDMYLPALPMLTRDLQTGPSQIQMTLSACILGLALGQLVIGPWSDTIGRRRPLFAGLAVYVVASLGCTVAPTADWLIGLRFCQGLGGSAALVIAMSVTRDLYHGAEAARFFSLLMLVMGLAPILAPLLGAQFLWLWSWHAIFVALAVAGLLSIAVTGRFLPETLPREKRHPAGIGAMLQAFGVVLRDRAFLGYALAGGLSFAAMFAYIAGSPFVLQKIYGLSPQAFSMVFGANAFGLIGFSQVNGRLVHRAGPRRMMAVGVFAALVGGIALLAVFLGGGPLTALLGALFLVVAAQGLIAPNASALALVNHARTAGSASALLGTFRFALGAMAAPLVGAAGEATAWPMAAVIAASCLAAVIVFLTTKG